MTKGISKDGMHFEYHNVNRKKDKAVNCIFLTEDRICHHKSCYCYLGYCFDSSHCPNKVKDDENISPKDIKHKKYKRIIEIDCTLPEGTIIHGRFNKIGVIHHYEKQGRKLFITFGEGKKEYIYPESFQSRAIWLDDELYEILAKDISKAKVE